MKKLIKNGMLATEKEVYESDRQLDGEKLIESGKGV